MMTNEPNELSERELDILRLVATGAGNKEIAQKLFISSNTVKVHLRNIFTKINATSRTEAAMYAVRIGLVQAVPSQLPADDNPTSTGAEAEVTQATPREQPPQRLVPRWVWIIVAIGLISMVGIGIALARSSTPQAVPTFTSLPAEPTPTSIPRWKELAAMPSARSNLAIVAFENHIYAIGGVTVDGVTGDVERYDPQTNSWTELSPKPEPVMDARAAVIGGLIYIPGGRTDAGNQQPTDLLEIYDPRLDQWSLGAAIPTALSSYAMVASEGRLYVFGGWDGSDYRNSVYMYDPIENIWLERTPMPTARGFCGAAESSGLIYVIGGIAGEQPLNTIEIYSPIRDTGTGSPWETGAPLPEGRYSMGIAGVADLIYLVGGIGASEQILEPLEFSPVTHDWHTFSMPLPESWSDLGMLSLGPNLYMVGGQIQGLFSPLHLSYQAIFTISIPIVQDRP